MISRRTFVRGGMLAGVAALAGRTLQGQTPGGGTPGPGTQAGDPLRWPGAVQPRANVMPGDDAKEVEAIEHRLKCTCGCNLDIFTCRTTDFTCTTSPALHREVMALRARGKNADEIVDAFVTEHGEAILMAPKPEGFNLAGYLVPGLGILTAGGILAAFLTRKERLRAAAAPVPAPRSPGADRPLSGAARADLERLEAALRDVTD